MSIDGKIIQGDSAEVLKKLPDECVDLVVTSPPYDCYSDDTEVLTSTGWKLLKDVVVNDSVLTLNPNTKELFYQNAIRTVSYPYNGNLINFKNQNIDLMVTPNHNMYVENRDGSPIRERLPFVGKEFLSSSYFKEAKDIKISDLVKMSGFVWGGEDKQFFILPSYKKQISRVPTYKILPEKKILIDDWLAFFGIWLADGSVSGSKGCSSTRKRIMIKQKEGVSANKIRNLLKKLPFNVKEYKDGDKYNFTIHCVQLHSYMQQFGNSYTKFVPREFMKFSPPKLKILFKWFLLGDGTKTKQGSRFDGYNIAKIYSSQLRDDFMEICVKMGFLARNNSKYKYIGIHHSDYTRLKPFSSEIYYNGSVVCIEVPLFNIILVRRNGKPIFCGNSLRVYDKNTSFSEKGFNFNVIADELYRVIKPGGVVVWVVNDETRNGSESGTSFKQVLYFKEIGFNIHDTMIYEKNSSPFPAKRDGTRYSGIFEFMWVLSKGKPKTANLICDKKNRWEGWVGFGKVTQREANGELKEYDRKPTPAFSPRNNIWTYYTGKNYTSKDKVASEHPACVDEITECLTINGWKTHNTLNIGDMVASLDVKTGNLLWKPVSFITKYQNNNPLVIVEGRHLSMAVSTNHRSIVVDSNGNFVIKTAETLSSKDKIPSSAKLFTKGVPQDVNFAKLLGWFISEGNWKRNGKGVIKYAVINQSLSANPGKVSEIRRLLKSMKIEFMEYRRTRNHTYDKTKVSTAIEFYLKGEIVSTLLSKVPNNKFIPCDILTWDIIAMKAFFFTMIKGDGCRRGKNYVIYQKSHQALDVMQAIGVLLGFDCFLSYKNCYVEFTKKKHKNLRNAKGSIIQNKVLNTLMWCPAVEDTGTFVARRKGRIFITGNSFPDLLALDHIRTWSNEGDLVLDPFMGSGTVAAMAKLLKRKYIGIELSSEYIEVINKRLEFNHDLEKMFERSAKEVNSRYPQDSQKKEAACAEPSE